MLSDKDTPRLVMEPSYPIIAKTIGQVVVIGCGGSGGYVVRDLARLISTLDRKVELVLIDGDVVEHKNLKRQNFIQADVGKNKAQALASRYGALGIEVKFVSKYLESDAELTKIMSSGITGSSRLVISCVDNVKTRKLIRQSYAALASITGNNIYWIDLGNEENTGQAVLAVNPYGWDTGMGPDQGRYPVPDVFDLYPELLTRADKLPTEMSCAELAAASTQFGFINGTAAMVAINWTHALLNNEPVRTHAVDFSTYNRFNHRPLTETALYEWMTFFTPIRDAYRITDSVVSKQKKREKDAEEAAAAEAKAKEKALQVIEVKTSRGSKKRQSKNGSKVEQEVKDRLIAVIKKAQAEDDKFVLKPFSFENNQMTVQPIIKMTTES